MKLFVKYSLFFSLLLSFSITSCDSDSETNDDDLKGIQLATTRSNGESEGIGLACNFGQIIKVHLEDSEWDEIKDELGEEGEEEFDKDKFDELLEELFGGFNKTMYMIVAGDDIDLENKGEIEVAGETFSLTWFSDSEEPVVGSYEAFATKINIENPDDLENDAKVSGGNITVELTDLTDELMIGTFGGTVTNKDGVEETIEGAFNVERASCDK